MMRKTILLSLVCILIALSFVSCGERLHTSHSPQSRQEGQVSLRMNIGLNDLRSKGITTPLSGSLDYESRKINSLAVFVIDLNREVPMILGYRIFLKPDEIDGKKYLFRKVHSTEGLEGIDDIEYTDHTNTIPIDDDSTPAESAQGFNGWTDESQESVIVNFKYTDTPMHGKTENLVPGKYYISCVANFAESHLLCESETASHDKHSIGWHINEIVNYYGAHKDDANFEGVPFNVWRSVIFGPLLLDGATHLSPSLTPENDFITHPSNIYYNTDKIVSTKAQEHNLLHGANNIKQTLDRLPSRLTFNITNNSTQPVTITDFSLSDNYAMSAQYLFKLDRAGFVPYPSSWRGGIDVTQDRAIVPFVANSTYSTLGETSAIFDALIIGAQDLDNPMSYSLTARVPVEPYTRHNYTMSTTKTTITQINDMLASEDWAVGEYKYFTLQNLNTGGKYASGKRVYIKSRPYSPSPSPVHANNPIGENSAYGSDAALMKTHLESCSDDSSVIYLWGFEKVDGTTILIKSMGTGLYVKCQGTSTGGDNLLFTSDPAEASRFTLHNYNGIGKGGSVDPISVAFTTTYSSTEIYLNLLKDFADRQLHLTSLSVWNDAGSHFYLYEASHNSEFISGYIEKSLTNKAIIAFNKSNGVPFELHEISRNDHIIVNINLKYNNHTQEFEFELDDWNESYNDVEFN